MDNQTLGAAIAISKAQVQEAIESIAGEIQGMLVTVADHKLTFTEEAK